MLSRLSAARRRLALCLSAVALLLIVAGGLFLASRTPEAVAPEAACDGFAGCSGKVTCIDYGYFWGYRCYAI